MARQRPTRIPTPQATMCVSFKVLVIIVKEEIVARTDEKAIWVGVADVGGALGWVM
ncbi:hypothetical protein DPMN_048179 [Dreissena polymorpha]|uniref:Uncharacterized protein n=1 Tax=Dreissena polymorpha TaxID=45954 RepID=A0A9D4DB35_DREPO|nr:hypothetical protein DPMN_048179 [Dreissena polymorpha]